jgi:hypothetical protein
MNHEDYDWLFDIMDCCVDLISKDCFCDRIAIGKDQNKEIAEKIVA